MKQYVDYQGLVVTLTDEAVEHILERHPDAAGYIDKIPEVLSGL